MADFRSANRLREEAGTDLGAAARRVLPKPLVALGGAHLDRVEAAALFGDLLQRGVALAALAGEVRGEEHQLALQRFASQHVGAAERLPNRVGAQQPAPRAGERA